MKFEKVVPCIGAFAPVNYYQQIFKRKSFHLFKNTGSISKEELCDLTVLIQNLQPLDPTIRTEISIVPEKETTCKRGGEYCILFYSETKDGYLPNIGYMGEQIDLYLASRNIGALWFGIGKVAEPQRNGLQFVIMMTIAKMPENQFRKDMFKAKRKSLAEIWQGETLGVGEIVRFTPSACNTQPWWVEHVEGELRVYRYQKPGKRGIMPVHKVIYYNRIDIGIFLFMLETCLVHQGISFERALFADESEEEQEKTLVGKYRLCKL